jgi:hypothetical protein
MASDPIGAEEPGAVPPDEVLRWMSENRERLGPLLTDEERLPGGGPAPADDAAIRAGLRLVAEALEAVAPPALAADLAGLADDLPEWFAEGRELFEEQMARAAGAIALEEHLQHGTRPGEDPSLDAGLDRRQRIWAWIRLFALALEARLGPRADGLAESVLASMAEQGRRLAWLILILERRARQAAAARTGGVAPTDAATLDEIGQAAVVQGYLRLLVETLTPALRAPASA